MAVRRRASVATAGAVVWLCAILGAGPHQQPSASAMPDVRKLGPQVGDRVPDFTLTDQHGRAHTLASLFGPKGLMLVFFRSADW